MKFILAGFISFILFTDGIAQVSDTTSYITIAAGPEYDKSASFKRLWGENRRKEWITPVRVPVLWLDKTFGGLTPYKQGGGNESRSLRLKTPEGKMYTLRSVNKSRADVVEPVFKGSFIEAIIVDGISMSHPYGALAVPYMEDRAGIYHANPRLVYLPFQPALDTFNNKFGNSLYLLEERLDGDWSDVASLGNFNNFFDTYDVIKKLQKDNFNKADQKLFLKSRLFDMLIADWDRHEDQWQWGSPDTVHYFFKPVPRDRDQAFFTHKGFLIDKMLPATGLGFMQNFDYDSHNISGLNLEERRIDRYFTNELDLEDWIDVAKELQSALTDEVIERSLRGLPPEIFAVSGDTDISKLKSRRQQLERYASEYYHYLAKDIDIAGSSKAEQFTISANGDGTVVTIERDGKNVYRRNFKPSETGEIRLYGIDGKDNYTVNGNNITLRIIGGPDRDMYDQKSNGKVHVYDDRNDLKVSNARRHVIRDSADHLFEYKYPLPASHGLKISVFYNNEDRLFAGIGYGFTRNKWRHEPYVTRQLFDVHYSVSQHAPSITYTATFPNLFGKWAGTFLANYDWIRWTNFYGLGNNSMITNNNADYFRLRTIEYLVEAGINKRTGHSLFAVNGFYQGVKIKADSGRYVAKNILPSNKAVYNTNNYSGLRAVYGYTAVNDSSLPVKGISLGANGTWYSNMSKKQFLQKYSAKVSFFIPIGKFSIALRGGGTAVVAPSGTLNGPEFYEHAVIGGVENMRGFKRERFWGSSALYNNNELRFITDIHTYIMNGTVGILTFYDQGRVWMPNNAPGGMHSAWGGGIILKPFKFPAITATYGISKEDRLIQVKLNRNL